MLSWLFATYCDASATGHEIERKKEKNYANERTDYHDRHDEVDPKKKPRGNQLTPHFELVDVVEHVTV